MQPFAPRSLGIIPKLSSGNAKAFSPPDADLPSFRPPYPSGNGKAFSLSTETVHSRAPFVSPGNPDDCGTAKTLVEPDVKQAVYLAVSVCTLMQTA
ncbi:hypothetical protein HMPREF1981_00490 [Bacteroides pyogenes F0041]|uniref:Uncharacterized protein n=1 Tax=Bacteroides pyogenes F0041 TaxID=1321819 RepID=U2E331_9BACE|nr:hypothetical protein [Bacteroides pyogenes]ERI88557.1 hypothetical protein HMPREF1981_00490 [Bacteroides pyogenes F0041]MBB3895601.1 hypothetical protein [Bacteroides pyogenes]GAE22136.1 hypothetical protein JCM10003_1697 [Bacteroides pyogenes JCM 10003]